MSDVTPITKHEGKKYLRVIYPASKDRIHVNTESEVIGIEVDVYEVLQAYPPVNDAIAHAVKKLLMAGGGTRGRWSKTWSGHWPPSTGGSKSNGGKKGPNRPRRLTPP